MRMGRFLLLLILLPTSVRAQEGGGPTVDDLFLLPFRVAFFPLRIFALGLKEGITFAEDHRLFNRVHYAATFLHDHGVFLRPGGLGDGAGPGGRLDIDSAALFSSPVRAVLSAGASFRNYQFYQIGVGLPGGLANSRLTVFGGYRLKTEENFFGLGSRSQPGDRSDFTLEESSAGGQWTTPLGPLRFLAGLRYRDFNIRRGQDDGIPDTQDRFGGTPVPGLGIGTTFLVPEAELVLDLRDDPVLPNRGLWAMIRAENYDGLRGRGFEFGRFGAEVRGYLPLGRPRRVLALRARAEVTDARAPGSVPFYLFPRLGSHDTLRGLRRDRLRDLDAALLTAEYRYPIWRHMDAVLFLEAGNVYGDLFDEFDLDHLELSYGGGVRILGRDGGVMLRLEIGASPERTNFILKFGESF